MAGHMFAFVGNSRAKKQETGWVELHWRRFVL